MKRVAIVHPWFPQYRVALFESLSVKCAQVGIDLDIYHGDPPPEWSSRGDDVVMPRLATRLPTRFIGVGGRHVARKDLRELRSRSDYDLIVVEHAIRNLDTYSLMASPRTRARLAWWGHGKTYTEHKPRWEERLKARLTSAGSWFFSYTEGGADAVAASGFPAARISVLNNSIDTTRLQSDVQAVDVSARREWQRRYGLTAGQTGLFIGGLDGSKRLDFLLEAASMIHSELDKFRLLIVGDGADRAVVTQFCDDNPWCIYLGPLFGAERAIALSSSDLLLMPGRVGLVAVDSFAASTPLATTEWPLHAPEFEYLTNGVNSLITANNARAYSEGVVKLLGDSPRLARLRTQCSLAAETYTIEAMAERFVIGIQQALRSSHPGGRRRRRPE